ncbi:MAG: S1-like domain-containing RNA-binding protein [Rikenellaceae bacterium]
MLKAGYIQKLHLTRFTDNGAYLMDEQMNEVLLPNRYLTKTMAEGDTVEVFVYHDSEDRLVASTDFPIIMCGEVDAVEVIDTSSFGVFLDWGLPKDLFMPKSNYTTRLYKGDVVVVAVYNDSVTGRVVATTRLHSFVNNDTIELNVGDKVRCVVAQENEVGYRVVLNDKNWGVIYHNQIFKPVEIGDSFYGWVTKITEDNRIDVSLQQVGYDGVVDTATQIVEHLKANGGGVKVTDRDTPEAIYAEFGMSKKLFKKSLGTLLKSGVVEQSEEGVKICEAKKD